MLENNTLVSLQSLAALKAHRTRLINRLPGTRGNNRADLKAKIAELSSQIEGAVVDPQSIERATAIALAAHVTRTEAKLPGTRGKARKVLQTKIADLEARIAA